MTDELIEAIVAEAERAEKLHGPLTTDLFRAFTILVEEVGELGRSLLELRRAGHPELSASLRQEARAELVQVMTTSKGIWERLTDGSGRV